MPPKATILQLPLGLPVEYFLEIVRAEPRFMAIFYEPTIQATLTYDGCAYRKPGIDHVWPALLACPLVCRWIEENHLDFGTHHWLVSDLASKVAFAMPVDVARKWVECQKPPCRITMSVPIAQVNPRLLFAPS